MITPVTWNPGLQVINWPTFSRTKPKPNMNCDLFNKKTSKYINAGSYIIQDIAGLLYVVHYNKKTFSWDKDPLYNPETGEANFKPII